jgi:uncharacterized protein (DUF1697 family)
VQHAVFLRGINLGPHNRIPMAGLREVLARRGFDEPRTYLQSGNVVLESDLVGRDLEQAVADAISAEFDLDIAVLALTAPDLASIVSDNPYRAQAEADPTRVHAMLVSPMPPGSVLAEVEADRYLPEEFSEGPGVIYLHLPYGMGRAKLPDILARVTNKSTVTVRNWRTVTAVAAMTEG